MSSTVTLNVSEALCIVLSLSIFFALVARVVEDYRDYVREVRRENLRHLLCALSYSDLHRPFLPLIKGMANELGVTRVLIQQEKDGALVACVVLKWWAALAWWVRRRLSDKAEKLLNEGDMPTIDVEYAVGSLDDQL